MNLRIFCISLTLILCFHFTPHECAQLPKRIKPHIINGNDAAPGQFPWLVLLIVTADYGEWWCGGAIINERHIVTAASCATNFITIVVYIPGFDDYRYFHSASAHDGYDEYTLANDIATVELEKPIAFDDNIKPIELSSEYIEENVEIVVIGKGQTNDSSDSRTKTVQYVTLSTMNNKDCGSIYGEGHILDDMLCAKSSTNVTKGTCFGDSGSPAVVNINGTYVLVGVASFISDRGCEYGDPSGFTRVSDYVDWIHGQS